MVSQVAFLLLFVYTLTELGYRASTLILRTLPVMSKYILDNLFGSKARVKLLKFLFRNSSHAFTVGEIARRTQETPTTVKQELYMLRGIHLVKKSRKRE